MGLGEYYSLGSIVPLLLPPLWFFVSHYMEHIALTGYMSICVLCKEYSNWLGIYSLGNPSTGSWCAGWLFYCPPVINQHRWETLHKWLPVNSLY